MPPMDTPSTGSGGTVMENSGSQTSRGSDEGEIPPGGRSLGCKLISNWL